MIFFDGDDAAYLDWLARNPDGYVVNVRRSLSPNYVVLHRSTCVSISTLREGNSYGSNPYTGRAYRKFCGRTIAEISDAPVRCGRANGSFTKCCSRCDPRR